MRSLAVLLFPLLFVGSLAVPSTFPGFFAYNFGGNITSIYAQDPEWWSWGETATYEVPKWNVGNVLDVDLYRTHRYGLLGGQWGYLVSVAQSGVYECSLYFMETYQPYFVAGQRVFGVTVKGDGDRVERQEKIVDVGRAVGGGVPYLKSVRNVRIWGKLEIKLRAEIGDAFLSGLKCVKLKDIV